MLFLGILQFFFFKFRPIIHFGGHGMRKRLRFAFPHVIVLLLYGCLFRYFMFPRTDVFKTQLRAWLCGGPQLFQRHAHPFTSSLPIMLPGRLELHMRMHSGLRLFSQPPPSPANPTATVPLSLHDCVVFLGLCLPVVAGKAW